MINDCQQSLLLARIASVLWKTDLPKLLFINILSCCCLLLFVHIGLVDFKNQIHRGIIFLLGWGGEFDFKKNVFLKNGYLEYISLPKIGLDKDRIQFYTFITILEERERVKKTFLWLTQRTISFTLRACQRNLKETRKWKCCGLNSPR